MEDKKRFEIKSTENISFRQIYALLVSVKTGIDDIKVLLKNTVKLQKEENR